MANVPLTTVLSAGGVTTTEAFAFARVPDGTPLLSVSIRSVQSPDGLPLVVPFRTSTAVIGKTPDI